MAAPSARPYLRLSGVETTGSLVDLTAIVNYTTFSEILACPGGGGWAWADINSLQVCIGLDGAEGIWEDRCTQEYIEVDYTPAAGGACPPAQSKAVPVLVAGR